METNLEPALAVSLVLITQDLALERKTLIWMIQTCRANEPCDPFPRATCACKEPGPARVGLWGDLHVQCLVVTSLRIKARL